MTYLREETKGKSGVRTGIIERTRGSKRRIDLAKSRRREENQRTKDSPKERIEEKQCQIHHEHDGESESGVISTEGVSKVLVRAVLNLHPSHDQDRIPEREREEEVGFGELASEDEEPEEDRSGSGSG